MNNAAYIKTVNELKEVVAGSRGFVALTQAAKTIGIDKAQLAVVAKVLGLAIDNHGRYGMCAHRPR